MNQYLYKVANRLKRRSGPTLNGTWSWLQPLLSQALHFLKICCQNWKISNAGYNFCKVG